MGKYYSILLFILGFVASSQLLAKYWTPYLLFDDILLLLIVGISIIDLIANNSFSKINILIIALFTSFLIVSFIVNFYSLNAFLAKLFYYAKPLMVFGLVAYLAQKYMLASHILRLYKIFIYICLFSWFEFYWVQFVDFSAIHYFSYAFRGGFYRASSITWHPISLASLGFLAIIIGKEVIHDKRWWPYIIFLGAIIFSGTRFIMLMLVLYLFYKFLIAKQFTIRPFTISGKSLFIFSFPFIFIIVLALASYINVKDKSTLRSVTFRTGLPLLSNPKILALGTGVGSFGSYESVLYESEIYERIHFPQHFKKVMSERNKRAGTENFFFMALIELGLIGVLLYFCVLLRLVKLDVTPFFTFYVLLVLCLALVYPINTLPYLYIINIFFPFGKKKKVLLKLRKKKIVFRNP